MIKYYKWRLNHALILTAVALPVIGCSDGGDNLPREAVSGTVTLDGKPLANGVIQFNPQSQAMSGDYTTPGGSMIQNGRYSIERERGLVPGTYLISVNASAKRGDSSETPKPGGGGNKGTYVAKELIPQKYNARTELKTEIKKGGSNDRLNFELKSQ